MCSSTSFKSELSQTIRNKIIASKWTHDEYREALCFLMRELGSLPEEAMVSYLASMYAACRIHPDVCRVIGDKIDGPVWVVAEVYIHVGRG